MAIGKMKTLIIAETLPSTGSWEVKALIIAEALPSNGSWEGENLDYS